MESLPVTLRVIPFLLPMVATRQRRAALVAVVQALALVATLSAGTARGQGSQVVNAAAALADVVWLASPQSNSCSGPTDGSGHAWTDPTFDEAGWTSITLPDANFSQDRYYRGHLQMAGPAADISVFVSSDDGCEVFINGSALGTFGSGCHQLGCVNRAGSCGSNRCVPPLLVSQSQLFTGDNVVAVHVSNGGGGVFFSATVLQGGPSLCGNCRLDPGEPCDPTVAEGECTGVLCIGPGLPRSCTCQPKPE